MTGSPCKHLTAATISLRRTTVLSCAETSTDLIYLRFHFFSDAAAEASPSALLALLQSPGSDPRDSLLVDYFSSLSAAPSLRPVLINLSAICFRGIQGFSSQRPGSPSETLDRPESGISNNGVLDRHNDR